MIMAGRETGAARVCRGRDDRIMEEAAGDLVGRRERFEGRWPDCRAGV
jgi:hypothetical protein